MKQLLRKLAELHISLDARDGQLDIYDPEQNLTTELLADLKAHKLSLLSLLEQSSNGQKQAAEIPPVAPKEYYRLSSAQKRMYIQYALNKDSIAYNITQTIELAADLDKAQLHLAFQQLVDRHEGFRTCFEMVEEQPMQRILPKVDFQVAHFFPLDSEIAETIQDFSCPFDLSKAPLIRAGLIHKADGTYILIVDIHHIVTDALSQDIIVDDFMAFYNGAQLPALDVQYKDYAEWQNSPEQIAEREKQEAFWMEELVGELPVLDIPTDFQRSQDNSDEGEYLRVYVREEDKQKLDAFCAEQQVTHSMVLCSFFSILMSKLSGQEDVMIGLSISGRDHSALERLIGMFVNLLPLRSFPERNKSFESFVDEVKGATLAALDNQNCQYDKLVEELGVQRNLGHNALFDVIFNYISRPDLSEDLTPEKTDHFTWGQGSKRLDITLNVTQYINTFLLEFQYDSNLFRRETAEQMLQSFLNLLTALPETKGKKLSEVYIASAASIQAIADEQQDYFAKPTAVDTFLPASYHQQRLWFIDKFEADYLYEGGPVYHNIPLLLSFKGKIDSDLIRKSFDLLIAKYDILRTSIHNIDEKPFQRIQAAIDPAWQVKKVDRAIESDDPILLAAINRPFKLDECLLRGLLLPYDQGATLLICIHHSIVDYRSIVELSRELLANYQALSEGASIADEGRTPQYAPFAAWQQNALLQLEPHLMSYWKRQLYGKVKALEIPTDRPRAAVHIYQAANAAITISDELTQSVRTYAEQQHTSMRIVLMAAFKLLLKKYCRHEEIVIGTSHDNRSKALATNLIGPAANLFVLRSFLPDEMTFSQQVKDLQETYDSSEAFRQMPFDKLVKELAPEKDMSRTALFDVLFQYEEPIDALPTIDGVAVEWTHTNLGYGKYDLNFFLQPTDQHLSGQLVYNADYFDHSTIERFIAHYEEVLQAVLKHPEVAISEVDMVTQKEKDFLLKALDHTAVDFPKNKTIVDFFEAQVDRQPDKTAITFEDQSITYAALDQRANQVAHLLKAKGIQGNEIVGLLTDRSLDVVVSMLGILKAGGAYLPIDVDYPRERIDYILENSGVRLLLTDDKYPTASLSDALTIMSIEAALQQATDRLESTCQPSDLCYIIYTSGTTGNPKGVMVEHRNVVRLFFNDAFQFDFGPSDTWTMFHSHCFDFSVWEMYGALLFGGRLIVIPKIVAKDATAYLQLLEQEGVTVLNQTPSAFYQLTREELLETVPDLSLRYVVFGGEALSPAKLKNWKATYPEVRLINMYGITETTVHVTFKEIEEKDIEQNISNIGTPIPTLLAYILDENRRLVPQGTIGELYVGGEGVTRGYLNRRALTNEKFIADPHGSNGKLYRTGDLARLLNNGEIEYIGRIDNQVQLRGFRIELGEIENQLATHQAIGETVVVAKEDEGDKFLIAYYVAKQSLEVSEMRNFLSAKLPDYMIPSYFVHLPTLPLTSNGKVDKKSLPDPQITSSDTYKAPVNAVEEKLVEIWSDILKLEKEVIGTESSFFDLGGHSLRAAVLVNKVSKELEVNIQLKEIFINQSIKELANYILAQSKSTYTQIEKAAEKEYYRLSSGQKRLYFLYEFDKESLAYNMPYVLELKGELDIDRLNQAFERLIDRHESLRTGFEIIGGAPVQRVYDKVDFKLACFHAGRAEVQGVIENFIRPFDLKQAPLLRVGIVELNPTEHLLMMDIHHIVTDGVSQRVLIDDFRQLYSSDVSLPPLQKQYKDYAEWQQQSEQQKEIERQKAFWMAEFADEASPIDLPTDFARPPLRKYDGGAFSFEMSVAESQQLKKIAEKEQTTLFMLLLACYNVLLSKLSNLEDITVGVPVAGRQHADLEKMIGMFVNTLAIRNQPEGKMTFTDFLAKVKSKTLACFENQSYQYEELVEELNIPRDTSRNPLFDLMFTFENFEEARFEIPALDIQPYDNGHAVSKFDLTLTASETADQIFLYFEYAKDLFTEETIERFTGYFRQILSTIATKPNSRIADIQMLQAAERTQILKDFNDTNVSYPPVDSILEVFEQQAAAHPDRVAIRFDRGVWTYRRLQVASDKVAYFLSQTKGWKKGDFIGLMLEREPAFLAILFGILKAGGVYVPIDPKYPADRVQAIVEEAGMKVLFTRGQFPKTIDAGSTEIIDLDTDWRLIRNMQYKRQAIKIDPKDLAYIIFTSGSTGRPKGVMIEHASLANIIRYMEDEYPLGASDSYLLKTTCCFDVSITEIFGWFFNGGSITLLPPRAEADPDVILDTIEKHQVTHINFVPSMFSVFVERLRAGGLEKLRSLKYIFLAGEALPRELVSQFDDLQTGILLENIYGPTEGTIYSCGYSTRDLGSKKRVPIGKPLSNISLYILDKNRSIQPVGVPGELCIGGAALARGYLNNEELTAEKFVAHPFEEGARIYRTGDLVRWLPDGNIEYLGRIDNQVKIRGYRIELGEIEIRLAEHEAIQECAVMVKERMGDKYLVGYYVSENALRATELVEHLATSLPAYMVPRYYVHMDKMPWTTNGKLNRRALPEPQVELEANYQAPIGETEEKLVEIWSKVLGLAREKISTDANFFDLGGHSLKIISMCNMVNDSFQANITVAEIFRLPHINAIAEFLHHGDQKLTEIEQGLDERSDALELLGRLGE